MLGKDWMVVQLRSRFVVNVLDLGTPSPRHLVQGLHIDVRKIDLDRLTVCCQT